MEVLGNPRCKRFAMVDVRDERRLPARKPVEEGRLSHVRPSDDDHGGELPPLLALVALRLKEPVTFHHHLLLILLRAAARRLHKGLLRLRRDKVIEASRYGAKLLRFRGVRAIFEGSHPPAPAPKGRPI